MASKVITLSATDAVEAQEKLQEWLGKNDKIIFLVLRDTQIAFNTVAKADVITGGALQQPRWVIHAPNPDLVIDILKGIQDPDGLAPDWEAVLACAISLADLIRDVIARDGKEPSFTRIAKSFTTAEQVRPGT